MIIYKDIISGDEMLTDTYKLEFEEDGEVIKVKGKLTTETTDIDDATFGGNKSAEEIDEGAEASSVSGIDVVLANRLVETGFGKKKDFQVYAKDYMGRVVEQLKENGMDEEKIKKFKYGASTFVKKICENFKEWQFFMGEGMRADAGMAYVIWEGETPYVYYLKGALEEEKV